MIARIVGSCHVGERHTEVLRTFIKAFKGGKRAWHKRTRQNRRNLIRMVVDQHNDNRAEYEWVMNRRTIVGSRTRN